MFESCLHWAKDFGINLLVYMTRANEHLIIIKFPLIFLITLLASISLKVKELIRLAKL